jgi:hypothetical protein
MTKRELIKALEALECSYETIVLIEDETIEIHDEETSLRCNERSIELKKVRDNLV